MKRQSFHFLTKEQTSPTNQRLLFWYSPLRRLWADFCRGRFCIASHRGYNRFCNNQPLTTIRADVQNVFLHRSFCIEFSADHCPRVRLSRLQRSLARPPARALCPMILPEHFRPVVLIRRSGPTIHLASAFSSGRDNFTSFC